MSRTFANLPGYEIMRRIGRGAGANIYEGRRRHDRVQFAIKHVVRRGPAEDRYIEQAETEYEVAHRLDHPHLRRYYELVRIRRWLKTRELFLLMEYVDGKTLEMRCKPQPPPHEFDSLMEVFIQVGEGLHAMHRQGFVHADIKPNNILLSRQGAKVIDFGQSCLIGHRKERIQGTPDYIAPEQVARHPLDQRTDVFNLGATMYWVVTRKWFRTLLNVGPTGTRKIDIDARSGSEDPVELNRAVPLALSRLIMECCAARPDDRPQDMREVVARLELTRHMLRRQAPTPSPSAGASSGAML